MVDRRVIKEWPKEDRPREKLFEKGAESLSDAELLAIILRTGNASTGESALDHGRALINRFRDLKGIDSAPINELKAIKGIGPAKTAQVKACLEIGRRMGREKWEAGVPLRSSEDVFRHFRPQFER